MDEEESRINASHDSSFLEGGCLLKSSPVMYEGGPGEDVYDTGERELLDGLEVSVEQRNTRREPAQHTAVRSSYGGWVSLERGRFDVWQVTDALPLRVNADHVPGVTDTSSLFFGEGSWSLPPSLEGTRYWSPRRLAVVLRELR